MKFVKTFILAIIGCTCCTTSFSACTVGRIHYWGGTGACPAGCFCPGQTYLYVNSGEGKFCKGESNTIRAKGDQKCDIDTSGTYKGLYGCTPYGYYGDCSDRFYRCPDKFPNSPEGAKSVEECYTTCSNGKKIYNKKVKCNKGYYLPAGGTSSSDCKSCNTINPATGAYCPEDGDYVPYCEDQGVKTCPAGKTPNTARTGCEDKVKCPDDFPYFKGGGQNTLERCYKKCSNGGTLDYKKIKCKKGEYLKGVSCKPCSELDPDAKEICPSDFEAYPECDGKIQSSKKCAPDETPNEDRTSCIGKEQSVPKGKYLRAKQDTPEPCPSGKYYCPGGDFRKEDKDQGKFQCPGKTKPNSEKSACMMVIEKEKMSLKKCWKQSSDPEKYKKCVFANTYYK